MTLRLRLTLIIVLVVALVLGGSGVGLHYLLRAGLLRGLDDSLQQAASLLQGFLEVDEQGPKLQQEGENRPQLRADLAAVVMTADGRVSESLGRLPNPLPRVIPGYSTQAEWRVLAEPVQGGVLLVMRETSSVTESVERFDRSFLTLAPLALLLAFVLGYLFAGQGLRPVDRLTRAAFDLAQRSAWRERLPEPKNHDEMWRLAVATNRLLATLAGVIESERRFTADAAHELRTPLTVLQGRLEQALERSDGEVRELVAKALAANEGLLELIEKLLALARAEAGQSLAAEPVTLDMIAFDAAETMRPLFAAKGLELITAVPAEAVSVRGDATALGLAVRNLLENALKFTPSGTVRLSVEVIGANARVSVEDSGPGIPEEALPHLFDRFYQADVRHRRGGSGLGLTLVHSIVSWHGGRVGAENRPEGGARVWLELPLA